MPKNLTESSLDRQNILNNRYALQQAEQHLALGESTIEKYLVSHADELKANGYTLLRGKKIKEFKEPLDGTVINYGTKTTYPATKSSRNIRVGSRVCRLAIRI